MHVITTRHGRCFSRPVLLHRSFILVLLGACGCSKDSRFAEQPLRPPNDSGIAFIHSASLSAFRFRDESGRVVDRKWNGGIVEPARFAHFTTKYVSWETRPLGLEVVSVFTLPPGRYEITVIVGSGVAMWPQAPLVIDVEPHRVTVLGELFCHPQQCAFDPRARKSVRDVLEWEIAQPHEEEDRAMWRTWLPAIERELVEAP
jgi:hypothetical protein